MFCQVNVNLLNDSLHKNFLINMFYSLELVQRCTKIMFVLSFLFQNFTITNLILV